MPLTHSIVFRSVPTSTRQRSDVASGDSVRCSPYQSVCATSAVSVERIIFLPTRASSAILPFARGLSLLSVA